MNRDAKKAFSYLRGIGCPVIETKDYGHFVISAENNSNEIWADYYDGPKLEKVLPNGDIEWAFGVNPKIHRVLNYYGLMVEWINPGMLGVYDL